MKLTFEQIKSITVGSVHTEQTEDGIHFAKCTQKQVDAWYALCEAFGNNSNATTGVRLDFHTNSTHLSLDFASGNAIEVYFDNILRHSCSVKDLHSEGKVIDLDITKPLGEIGGDTHVTVYLTAHQIPAVLRYLELDDGATLSPHVFDRKMLFFGDSITQGWDSGYDSLSYANFVSRAFNAESVIQGVGGGYFDESTFDPALPFDPDVVVVAYGTNDFYARASYDDLRAHCAAYLSKIADAYAKKGKTVFVLLPLWRGDRFYDHSVGDFATCRAIIAEEAKKLDLICIDTINFIPPLAPFFADDVLLHPNALGFAIYAQNLVLEMQKHLK